MRRPFPACHALRSVGTTTGNSFASFLLGYVDSANISTPIGVSSIRPYYAGFVQDDFKVSTRLTLNLGLRFDYHNAEVPVQDLAAIPFVPARHYDAINNVPNWKDLSPRAGVDPTLVVAIEPIAVADLIGSGQAET